MFRASILLMWLTVFLHGQSPTGELRIEVDDQSGAGMKVSGKLENSAAGFHRNFQTDNRGRFVLSNLPAGTYVLQVTKAGFAPQSVSVEVQAGAPVERSLTMTLAGASFEMNVAAATPLTGTDLPLDQIPAPVQTATGRDLESSGAPDFSSFLNRRAGSVNINENQGNPFQPDVNYRGYTASPLLGTPEGISIYMDGVRQNQPFGDVVAWDLIPRQAIDEATLIPGSNPIFGLNTLGGAISLQTKNGHSQPGTSIEATGGMYGRRGVELEHGGSNAKGLSWYFAGNLFHDDGWREASPSDVRQVFVKGGWQNQKTSIELSAGYADNQLTGNGLQEMRFLAKDYSSVYSVPDIGHNRSPYVNLKASHAFSDKLTVTGNAYFRYIRGDTYNANLNSNSFDEQVYTLSAADQAALKAAGYTGYPTGPQNASTMPFPYWRCIAQALQLADPSSRCDGAIFSTWSKQNNYGLSQQLTWVTAPQHRRNQFTAGWAFDRSSLTFQQSVQFAYLNPDGTTFTPVNAYADGSTSSGGVPVDSRVDLHGAPQTVSVYATDTYAVASKWSLTASARYNRTSIDNRDRLPTAPGVRGSLDGNYIYNRVDPAIGFTYNPTAAINVYGSYSEGSRAPTSIELGCSDPQNPCNLPNALVGDPPLKQVVTRTVEAGVRGSFEGRAHWSAGWFRGENHDDILFVASVQTGNGYFKNFGKTLREGAEVSVNSRIRHVTLGGNYTFVRATYQSSETVLGASNSENDAGSGLQGNIEISPGDRIPLIPHHIFKSYADWQATSRLLLDIDFLAVSRSFARGNENNMSQPDGVYYLGPGTSPGYGVVNLGVRYQLHRKLQLFAQIDNLLNHHYYTAAQLGTTPFTNSGTLLMRPFPPVDGNYPLVNSTFYAPGAPFMVWGGMRFTF
jgi:outer membrane receptor protein involved in Fe transport